MSREPQTKQLCIRLRELRREACVSVHKIARETGITPAHIAALENCDYDALPQGSVRKTIVKQYAHCIGYDPDKLTELFDELNASFIPPAPTAGKYATHALPTTLRTISAALAVIALLAYLGLEVHAMIGPPMLTINNPTTNLETHTPQIDIIGTTAPESRVTINGLKTTLDPQGNFSETIHLKEGVNEIIIVSEAKRGGQSSTSRTVLYAPDTTKAASAEPNDETTL